MSPETIKALAAFAWPALAFAFVFFFRRGIGNLFESFSAKNWKVELPGGFSASALAAEQKAEQSPSPTEVLRGPLPPPSHLVAEAEGRILHDLRTISEQDRQQALVRALANVQVQGHHEWVYNRIFGSQILFLKKLNQVASLTVEEARRFWQPYEAAFPQLYRTYSFESWLHFMTSTFLISREGDTLKIATAGNDFLIYLAAAKLSEERPW